MDKIPSFNGKVKFGIYVAKVHYEEENTWTSRPSPPPPSPPQKNSLLFL